MSREKEENLPIKDIDVNNEKYLQRKEVLTSFFSDKDYQLLTVKQMIVLLNIKKDEINMLNRILEELEQEGIIYLDESKRYVPTKRNNMVKCKYQMKSNSFGFGILENGEDIYISGKYAGNAMNGDEVLVQILTDKSTSSKSAEGKIVKVLKRSTKVVIGRFLKDRNFGFVEPIDSKLNDIYIPKKYCNKANHYDFVEVKIEKYATLTSKAEGKIIRVIGNLNVPNMEVKALEISYGLDQLQKFGKLIEKELEEIPDHVLEEECIGRKDRTKEIIVTIDGDDAKDLDDAVSLKKLENGNYLLSVYIADVSHYVREGTQLDKEAIARGTSTYIPGTVIPMLPKKLSNGICSLNEGVKRLALGVDMEINSLGEVIQSDVFQCVIQVSKRMSYDKVYQAMFDEKIPEGYEPYLKELEQMRELALILKERRNQEGSINFDIPETKVILDEVGNVVDIKAYEITIANQMIEEFMLITNRTIAEKFFFLEIPFIYRIHEKPDEEKLRDLNEVLALYHKRIKGVKNIHPKVLSELLDSIEDKREKDVISTLMLRTLKLARYSSECDGHFGLAAKYYCHFTSPIRRYPDLFIHRMISMCIENGYELTQNELQKYAKKAEQYAKSSSECEKQATTIEREFDNLYIALYMANKIDQEYEAVVSSVTSFGMFVKLQNTVEGLIPFSNMSDQDYYLYDEVRNILIGQRTGNIYRIGDKVRVKVVKVDVKLKQVDFKII